MACEAPAEARRRREIARAARADRGRLRPACVLRRFVRHSPRAGWWSARAAHGGRWFRPERDRERRRDDADRHADERCEPGGDSRRTDSTTTTSEGTSTSRARTGDTNTNTGGARRTTWARRTTFASETCGDGWVGGDGSRRAPEACDDRRASGSIRSTASTRGAWHDTWQECVAEPTCAHLSLSRDSSHSFE